MQSTVHKQGIGIDKTVQNNLIIPINGPASLYILLAMRRGP